MRCDLFIEFAVLVMVLRCLQIIDRKSVALILSFPCEPRAYYLRAALTYFIDRRAAYGLMSTGAKGRTKPVPDLVLPAGFTGFCRAPGRPSIFPIHP